MISAFFLNHLIDRFQKSILQLLLPKMRRWTRGTLRFVLPVAAPYLRTISIRAVPNLAAIIRAAFPADNPAGEYTDRAGMPSLLLAVSQFMLDKVEHLLRDNRRMAVLDIVLGNLSLIRFLFLLKEIDRERLLQQGVSFVLLICQDALRLAFISIAADNINYPYSDCIAREHMFAI